MGTYSTDIIGQQFCYAQRGQTIPANSGITFSTESHCRRMKAIQAFSWANFVFRKSKWLQRASIKLILCLNSDNPIRLAARRGYEPKQSRQTRCSEGHEEVEVVRPRDVRGEQNLTRPPPPVGYPIDGGMRRENRSGSERSSSGRSGRSGQRFVYPDAHNISACC
ncbi:hypothetical protein FRC12_019756 [Ceratobasidium sp. 428]|nr:hypothetical protein FRC12_019756 [Ceratobasidium sp. 428]